MENKKASKTILSEWLEKIQQDSWQLELLISGLALYGVYNGIDKVEDYSTFITLNITQGIGAPILGFSYFIVYVGWRIFFFNLLIHVILRGLWIASIGLRYVSNEIDFKELNYADEYTNYLQNKIGSYDEFIEKLEKLCSIIFAFTFLVFLILVSLIIFALTCILPLFLLSQIGEENIWAYLINIIVVINLALGAIVAIDFISLGSIKKIRDPWVIKLFSPLFKFYSYVTLSFMYRPILYNFLDQKYTRRFFLFVVPYVIFLASFDNLFTNHLKPHRDSESTLVREGLIITDYRYEDLLKERLTDMSDYQKKRYLNLNLEPIIISSYEIQNNKLEFFLGLEAESTGLLNEKFNIEPIYKEGMQFNLFVDHKRENSKIKAIQKSYLEKYSVLRKDYNKQRDIFAAKVDTQGYHRILKLKRDSINQIIDSLETLKTNEIQEYKKENNQMILDTLVSTLKVKIDTIDYSDSLSCKYFTNNFLGSEGILCNLFEVELPKGNKIIEFTQTRYAAHLPDSIRYSKIKIPVYIE